MNKTIRFVCAGTLTCLMFLLAACVTTVPVIGIPDSLPDGTNMPSSSPTVPPGEYPVSADLSHRQEPYARGIILFIGDGMGEAHRTAARWAGYGEQGALAIDGLTAAGWLRTAPFGGSGVTDSAAAGTAMATGVKTYNSYIGVDDQQLPVESILEIAQQRGYAVGLVTTTQLGHATPASFAAHVPNRNDMTTIVDQMLATGANVLLGGGEDDFLPVDENGCYPALGHRTDERNLLTEAAAVGYTVICDAQDLNHNLAQSSDHILGLFGDDGMLPPHTPSLAAMTEFALEVLSGDSDGFFLMVEGGQIDWAAHDNDAARVISHTLAFDAAVARGIAFAGMHEHILVIVAADHETGGMSVSWENAGQPGQDGPFLTPDDIPFYVQWTTGSHTGADVPVSASGLCADNFDGTHENTYIFDVMLQALQGCAASPGLPGGERSFFPLICRSELTP
ncbi:MAG: alkaline phosphatase [Anaerolineae bacterium]|nr:alkaline phosphatase [Anaerolineae bacterium]